METQSRNIYPRLQSSMVSHWGWSSHCIDPSSPWKIKKNTLGPSSIWIPKIYTTRIFSRPFGPPDLFQQQHLPPHVPFSSIIAPSFQRNAIFCLETIKIWLVRGLQHSQSRIGMSTHNLYFTQSRIISHIHNPMSGSPCTSKYLICALINSNFET